MKQMIEYRVKGQPVFIGLEDSKRTWKLCVRSGNQIVHELGIPASFDNLIEYLMLRTLAHFTKSGILV